MNYLYQQQVEICFNIQVKLKHKWSHVTQFQKETVKNQVIQPIITLYIIIKLSQLKIIQYKFSHGYHLHVKRAFIYHLSGFMEFWGEDKI